MNRRFKHRRRQIGKLGLKTVLVVAAIGAAGIMTATLFLITYFREEPSMAAYNPMVVSEITVFQENTPILKGSTMQNVLGVRITVKGNSNKLNLVSMEFTNSGTSTPVSDIIQNVRLWSTGKQDYFIPSRQLSTALEEITEGPFRMDVGTALQDGDNYFWLTYDISSEVKDKGLKVDAEMLSANIGTLVYYPDRSALKGAIPVIDNLPYYSTGNGDISSLSSWNTSRDGSGKQPVSFNQSDATYFIQPGHILTNALSGCIPAIIIERNGTLKSDSEIKADFIDVQAGGTYIQGKEFANFNNLKKFILRNNGNYLHANSGNIPGQVKNFESHSTIILTKYSDATFKDHINWGNLVIDSKDAKTTDIAGCFRRIKGDLEIRSTGINGYLCTTSSDTIEISGNMNVTGGRFVMAPVANKTTLVIGGQLIIDKGWISDILPGKSNKGNVQLIPGSLILLRSGTFHFSGVGSKLVFVSANTTWSQSDTEVMLPDVEITQGSTLNVRGELFGLLPKGKTFIVRRDAVCNAGKAVIQGTGKFILEDYGSISTEHPEGINSSNTSGTIQLGSSFFSSNSNYIFKGASSPQMTGLFDTNPDNGTVNTLTISKERMSDVVMLQQPFRIKGRLLQQRGSINKNSFQMDIGEKSKTAIVVP